MMPVEDRPRRFAGIVAALDHPLATGFLVTIGVLGALVLGSAIGSISTILVYIILAMFLAVNVALMGVRQFASRFAWTRSCGCWSATASSGASASRSASAASRS